MAQTPDLIENVSWQVVTMENNEVGDWAGVRRHDRYSQIVPELKDMESWTDRTGHARLRSFVADNGRFWLEQNSQKRSKWSALATKGHQIAWEFEGPRGPYTGRMLIDGEICTPAEATKKYFKK